MCMVKSTDITEHKWAPFPDLVVTRELCQECGASFDNKTQQLQNRLISTFHGQYIEWEQKERNSRQLSRRQQRLPGV